MAMLSQFPLCRMAAALVFLGAFAFTVQAQPRVAADAPAAQPVADRAEALQNNDDEVVLFLVYNFGHWHRGEDHFVPQLVVWKDGRVLFGHFNPTPERPYLHQTENWTYAWGKIDPRKTEELIRRIRTDFGFGRNGGAILDVGPGGGTWTLQGTVEGQTYSVATWQRFNNLNAAALANRPVSGQVDGVWGEFKTVDSKLLTLREFYNIWRQTKSDVIKWGEAAVKENLTTVQVVVVGVQMTVRDAKGKILVHVPRLPRR